MSKLPVVCLFLTADIASIMFVLLLTFHGYVTISLNAAHSLTLRAIRVEETTVALCRC